MSTRMRSRLRCAYKLFLRADLDPDQVTRETGMEPSETWRIGEPLSKGSPRRHDTTGWSIKSSLPESRPLEEHVNDVLDRLRPAWDIFVRLGAKYECEMDCVVYSYGGDQPAIFFEEEAVRRIAELGASIGVDLLIMP